MPPRLTRALSLRGDAAPPLPRTTSAPPPRPLSLSFPVQRQTPISPGPHAHVILPSPDVMHSPHWPLTVAPLAEAHMRHRTPATCAPAPCDTSAPPRSLAFSFIALRATVSKRHVVPTYSSLVEHTILAARASCLDPRQQSTAHVPRPRAMMHLIPVPRRIAASQAVAPDRAAASTRPSTSPRTMSEGGGRWGTRMEREGEENVDGEGADTDGQAAGREEGEEMGWVDGSGRPGGRQGRFAARVDVTRVNGGAGVGYWQRTFTGASLPTVGTSVRRAAACGGAVVTGGTSITNRAQQHVASSHRASCTPKIDSFPTRARRQCINGDSKRMCIDAAPTQRDKLETRLNTMEHRGRGTMSKARVQQTGHNNASRLIRPFLLSLFILARESVAEIGDNKRAQKPEPAKKGIEQSRTAWP
ncbi:hypothetical protein DFH06DRAFT_1143408 [Mycena polygramma]|nr:hypothetical protein DFH06DRAFT_1143408 [Mycena polygramma]